MSKNANLTMGNPAKALISFSIPILIGMVLQQLYSTIDSVIVGNYEGTHALGAVGTTFPITFIVVAVASGLANGASIIVGKSFGAGEQFKINKIIKTTMNYSVLLSVIIGITLFFCAPLLLILIQASPEIYDNALIYLRVYGLGFIFTFAYNVMSGIFRALGDSKTPLIFLGVASVINIILDLVFVAVFGMGVFGVAIATVIAQGVSFILQLIMLNARMKTFKTYEENAVFPENYSKLVSKELIKYAIPSMLNSVTIGVNIFVTQAFVNVFGADASGAYAAGSKVESFAMMPMINMSIAMTAFTAQNMGAKKPERVIVGLKYAIGFCAIVAAVVGVIVFVSPELLIRLFINDASQSTLEIGVVYLIFMIINLLWMVILFPIEGVLRGSGDVKVTALSSVVDTVVKILVSAILIYVFSFGLIGVWIGGTASWAIHSILLLIRYKTGRWKHIFDR